MTKSLFSVALEEAHEASTKAYDAWTGGIWPCGFVWCNVGLRDTLGKEFKKNRMGRAGVYKGWTVSSYEIAPSTRETQNMDRKLVAVEAAVAVFKKHFPDTGMFIEQRMD